MKTLEMTAARTAGGPRPARSRAEIASRNRPAVEDGRLRRFVRRNLKAIIGLGLFGAVGTVAISLATWAVDDPSLSFATDRSAQNTLGYPGAVIADLAMQFLGVATLVFLLPLVVWGWRLLVGAPTRLRRTSPVAWVIATLAAAAAAGAVPAAEAWPLPVGLGGVTGDLLLQLPGIVIGGMTGFRAAIAVVLFGALALATLAVTLGFSLRRSARNDFAPAVSAKPVRAEPRAVRRPAPTPDLGDTEELDEADDDRPARLALAVGAMTHTAYRAGSVVRRSVAGVHGLVSGLLARDDGGADHPLAVPRIEPRAAVMAAPEVELEADDRLDGGYADEDFAPAAVPSAGRVRPAAEPMRRVPVAPQATVARAPAGAPPSAMGKITRRFLGPAPRPAPARAAEPAAFELPALDLLVEPRHGKGRDPSLSEEALEENARLLESVLDDFGIRGEIVQVRPGPVVTLYELEPAPGIKSSRVIGLADDIARSMSAIACRVAVIPGKNAIGIELPNARRETVFLRELLAATDYVDTKARLPLAMGKTIGGEPVITDLARTPHMLVAGTTGSGKSVSINTMILSLLFRLTPAECRLIMIDPKMLELSTYDGIPHLLTPVVTDPKKAVVALKWTVREMEDRYKKMSKVGVRNIDGLNARIAQAKAKGEAITRTVQTGFDRETGQAILEEEELSLEPMPYIVVIIDEMADLMMVAGKDIEGAVQRLAQMARAAGIHVVMATQRPSVDVITGTIKANFPTRVSFQVTSKIDSRTILGEQGAEQLLGQGDMLYMMGGGRIQRVHGPFVSDGEVEKVVAHLKLQGVPDYLSSITEDDDAEAGDESGADAGVEDDEATDLYDKAVAVVLRDKKVSTSYVQRRLGIGYNRAASIIEKMEKEGVVSAPNSAGKREILVPGEDEDPF